MTRQLKTTLTELVQMAREGNRHAVPTLRQILEATTDRNDRQHVVNAIQKAERPAAPKISPAVFTLDPETAVR